MMQGDSMNGFRGWLMRFGAKISQASRAFMVGRYGTDKLNMYILGAGVAMCIVSMFFSIPGVNVVLTLLSYVCMIWAICRSLSRNTYKRYQENRKFLLMLDKIKDREHRYFDCPRCRQQVRVPRGKGKISITCPKCRAKFVKKT